MNKQISTAFLSIPDAGAPEWVQLMPAGEFRAVDGRGPWRVTNAKAVITASMAGGKIVLDENHSTDLAAKQGHTAPARGWIVEMQARADGIWGRIEWTESGKALMADAAYRGVSPVFTFDKSGQVLSILRAALTNDPATRPHLKALHHATETEDMNLEALAKAAGLAADADLAAITAKVTSLAATAAEADAQVARLAKAAGDESLKDAGKLETFVQALAVKAAGAGDADDMATQVAALQTQIATLQKNTATKEAERFVDQAILAGKPIKARKEQYVALHVANPKGTEEMINALPSLHEGGVPAAMLQRTSTAVVGPDAPQTEILAAAAKHIQERKAAGEEVSHSVAVRFVTGT
jgi:phage I-like protein